MNNILFYSFHCISMIIGEGRGISVKNDDKRMHSLKLKTMKNILTSLSFVCMIM